MIVSAHRPLINEINGDENMYNAKQQREGAMLGWCLDFWMIGQVS